MNIVKKVSAFGKISINRRIVICNLLLRVSLRYIFI